MSDHHAPPSADDPLLSPPPILGDSPPLPLSAYYHLLLLLLGAVASVIATVALILNAQPRYEVDVFSLSSFELIKNKSMAAWEARLSGDPYVAREARSWLYSRSGVVSVTSAAANSGWGAGELVLLSNFTMREADEEADARDGVLVLDLLVEANETRVAGATGTASSYLMVVCSDLEIQFAAGRCGGQIYATNREEMRGSDLCNEVRSVAGFLI